MLPGLCMRLLCWLVWLQCTVYDTLHSIHFWACFDMVCCMYRLVSHTILLKALNTVHVSHTMTADNLP